MTNTISRSADRGARRPAEQSLAVTVTGGSIHGMLRRGLRMWRGIPYAAAPVGPLRFRSPRPVAPWEGVRSAEEFGPVSMQDRHGQFLGPARDVPMSEDCLTINVIAPPAAASSSSQLATPRPVMVWIHGGAYSVGSSREMAKQGETFVRDGDVIFVNFNYRLGALGYLDFTRYSTAARRFESNLGLRDQLAALEWVRDNIAAFGGDPHNVTLFGESAGANAVTTLMTVPDARGLFARAIAESSPTNATYPRALTAVWAGDFLEILSEIVDDSSTESTTLEDASALLELATGEQLALATSRMQRSTPDRIPGTISLCPVIDGDFLPERPLDAFKAGRAHPIPLIIGTNQREGSLFKGRLDILATTPSRIRAIFAKTKKKSRKALKALYPGLPERRAAADFAGDYAFWFPTVKVAERHSKFAPVHFYRFDIAPRLLRVMGLDATHGIELFAVFDRAAGLFGLGVGILGGYRAFNAVGRRMRANWIRFARDGSVDQFWPLYDAEDRRTLIIDTVDRIESDPQRDKRLAWQEFVPHI